MTDRNVINSALTENLAFCLSFHQNTSKHCVLINRVMQITFRWQNASRKMALGENVVVRGPSWCLVPISEFLKLTRCESHYTLNITRTRPQLIEMPSLALSPVAPVRLRRSDPARSTKWNLAVSVSYSGWEMEPSDTPFTSPFISPFTWKSKKQLKLPTQNYVHDLLHFQCALTCSVLMFLMP